MWWKSNTLCSFNIWSFYFIVVYSNLPLCYVIDCPICNWLLIGHTIHHNLSTISWWESQPLECQISLLQLSDGESTFWWISLSLIWYAWNYAAGTHILSVAELHWGALRTSSLIIAQSSEVLVNFNCCLSDCPLVCWRVFLGRWCVKMSDIILVMS
jgi:hypothetical protein